MARLFNHKDQTRNRQKLRNQMPTAELLLWYQLKGKQLNNYKFRRQYGIKNFIVDFYCPKANLAIEVDGDSHFQNQKQIPKDLKRQRFIQSLGIKILRFTNLQIYYDLDRVIGKIAQHLH